VNALDRRRWPETIKNFQRLVSQVLQSAFPRLKVVVKKVRQLMRQRESLFVLGIGAVDECESEAMPRVQTCSQTSIRGGNLANNTVLTKPAQYRFNCR